MRLLTDEMKSPLRIAFSLLLASVWLSQAWPALGDPESEKKKPKKAEGSKAEAQKDHGGGDPLRNLSPEEREKFREVMRQAWSDPAVLQARDEVKEATVAYQKALIEAIKRNDPEVVALMEKIRAAPDSPIKSLFSGGGPGGRGRPGGSGFRDFEAFISGESPSFLKNLTEEQKGIYRKAREQALQSSEFQEMLGKLRKLRENDEAMRNERIELFGQVRQILTKQMIEADKRVKAFLPQEMRHSKGPPPNGRRGPAPSRKRPDSEKGDSPEPPGKPE